MIFFQVTHSSITYEQHRKDFAFQRSCYVSLISGFIACSITCLMNVFLHYVFFDPRNQLPKVLVNFAGFFVIGKFASFYLCLLAMAITIPMMLFVNAKLVEDALEDEKRSFLIASSQQAE